MMSVSKFDYVNKASAQLAPVQNVDHIMLSSTGASTRQLYPS
jgi:hypothetical protein